MKKKLDFKKYVGPIIVNNDVWFYTSSTGRSLEFVVYDADKRAIQFKVPVRDLEKLLRERDG